MEENGLPSRMRQETQERIPAFSMMKEAMIPRRTAFIACLSSVSSIPGTSMLNVVNDFRRPKRPYAKTASPGGGYVGTPLAHLSLEHFAKGSLRSLPHSDGNRAER